MTFDVAPDAYGRFMGRYSEPLALEFVRWSELTAGQRALDVGCGPGALTAQLVQLLGADAVSAIDPSAPFVAALQTRFPAVDTRRGAAEDLPYPEDTFDATLAQLVVSFMNDPVAGLAQMRRVTQPGGRLAACVWDHAGGRGPLSTFWRAAHDIDPAATDESASPGAREGDLARLSEQADWQRVEASELTVTLDFATFADWWEPFTLGVGPVGDYLSRQDAAGRDAVRDRCAELLPSPPFTVTAVAWAVRGRS
jgi:SAM-dependent methyltransferase